MRWSHSIPNLFTAARMALTPAIVLMILAHDYREALLLVAIAGATDGLDGFTARKLGSVTQFGAYLDPIADKLLLGAVYLALGASGDLPVWLVAMVFGRDIAILLFAALAWLFTTIRKFPPSIWGKLSTLLQIGAALLVLGARARLTPESLIAPGIALAAAGTAWSGLHYAWRGAMMLRLNRASA